MSREGHTSVKRILLWLAGPLIIGLVTIGGLVALIIGAGAMTFNMTAVNDENNADTVSASCTPEAGPDNIPEEYQDAVSWAAEESGLSQEIIAAQIDNESGWEEDASSGKAHGISQFTEATWAEYGEGDIWDPEESIKAQGRFMKVLMEMYEDKAEDDEEQVVLALAAYNAGPGRVQQFDGVPPYQETEDYVKDIPAAAQGNFTEDCERPDTGGDQVGDVGSGDWTHPLPGGDVTSTFGTRPCPAGAECNEFTTFHGGIDFANGGSNDVLAPTDMEITAIDSNQYQGHFILARQQDPNDGNGYVFEFHHCQAGSEQVAVGDTVAVGEPICLEGNTGNSSGAHLHLQIGDPDQDDTKPDQTHDYAIDPEPVLTEAGVSF